MEKRDVRVTLYLSKAEVDALDAYRVDRRVFTRSDAIRALVLAGLGGPPAARRSERSGPPRGERLQMVFTQSEVDALDAWRAKYQVWARSEALRCMIAAGAGVG